MSETKETWHLDEANQPRTPTEGGESLYDIDDAGLAGFAKNSYERLSPELVPPLETKSSSQEGEEVTQSWLRLSVLGGGHVPSDTFTHTFLQSIVSSVDSRDPVVANAWMETLLDVIDLLPVEVIQRNILRLAVTKGQLCQPISSRLLCCKMLGKLCTKFESYVIKKEILPMVQGLCQDVNFEVRACMCRQLDIVANGIELEAIKSAILPELVELTNDEECLVRISGIQTVVEMLSLLDYNTCVDVIIPLVKKFCETALCNQDLALPILAKELGRICHSLSNTLTPDQKSWFLDLFRKLAKRGLSQSIHITNMPDIVPQIDELNLECRDACAYNFPAMALFCGEEEFDDQLGQTLWELCCDPHVDVRATIAGGFHEVTRILGTSANVLKEFICLLQDDSLKVMEAGLLDNLPQCLESVTQHLDVKNESQEEIGDLIRALVKCEATLCHYRNWRLHAHLLSHFSNLPRFIHSNQTHETFVPLLFNRLHTVRPLPCRLAAAYSLLMFLRHTPSIEQQVNIILRLNKEFCRGNSCHSRMLYVRLCELAMVIFSKSFFKKHFFRSVLMLADDPVANVRLRICGLFGPLKAHLLLPTDGGLLHLLEAKVRHLMTNEKDRDVTTAVCHAIEELDKIEVAIEPGSQRNSCPEIEVDLNDLEKEVEEMKLLEKDPPEKTKSLPRSAKIPTRKKFGTIPRLSPREPPKNENSPKNGQFPKSNIPIIARKGPETKPVNDCSINNNNINHNINNNNVNNNIWSGVKLRKPKQQNVRRPSTPPPISVSKIPTSSTLRRRSMVLDT